ncbi:MAG TPA: hypothetical protein VGK59_02855 [Ohtaekwangia sp.]
MTAAQNNRLFVAGSLIIGSASLALDFYSHSCGLLLTPDSQDYLAAATSFRTDQMLLNQHGSPYVYWPPLFPMILSLFGNPQAAMVWVNFFIKVIIGILLFRIAQKYIRHTGLQLSFMLVTLCGVHLLMISVYLWSELIFLLLVLINFYAALHHRLSRIYFITLLTTGFMICLQRNAGFFYVSAVSVWLLVHQDSSLISRLIISVIFFIVSVSGLSIWHVYVTNLHLAYRLDDYPFFENISGNTFSLLISLGKFFLSGTVGVIIAILILVASILYALRLQLLKGQLLLAFLIVVTYLPGLAFVEALPNDEMDRFLSVIIPFLCILIFAAADQLFRHKNPGWRASVLVVLICWNTYSLARTVTNAEIWHIGSCSAKMESEHSAGS